MKHQYCIAITGASGAVYAVRLLEVLLAAGYDVHLSISPTGRDVLQQELDLNVDLDNFKVSSLLLGDVNEAGDSKIKLLRDTAGIASEDSSVLGAAVGEPGRIHYHHFQDFMAPIASGTVRCRGMVICPCSGSTLSAVARGTSANLIQRAAEVHLKERWPLILVPRETPISKPHIENLRLVAQAGATVLPASPGWYHNVKSLRDLVDFIVGRICDQLGIDHKLVKRWGE